MLAVSTEFAASVSADSVLTVSRAMILGPNLLPLVHRASQASRGSFVNKNFGKYTVLLQHTSVYG